MSDSPNPRIRPVADPTPEVREIYKNVLSTPTGDPLNVFATLAHNPRVLKRFSLFAGMFLAKNSIPVREREIVILRVARNCRSIYEFGQHTVIGRNCGLRDDEIAALAHDVSPHPWSVRDRDLIVMTDEICANDCVSDPTWQELRAGWTDAELCELVLLVGLYRMVAGFLNTMGVELDPDTPGWPN